MRAERIIVEPFTFAHMEELKIVKEINQHAQAVVRGILDKDTDEELLKAIPANVVVTIKAESTNQEVIIFKGIIGKISLKIENGLRILRLWSYSHTYLLDKKKQTRIFQNTKSSFSEMIKYIGSINHARAIYTEGKGKSTGRFIIQYGETDWEFLKRIASMIHTVIVADNINGKVSYCLGIPKLKKEDMKNIDIQTMEIWEPCSISEGRERDYVKDGTLIFGVETREVLELCTPLDFQGKECIISRVECRIEGKELLNAYELVEIRNIRTAEKLHKEISGVSLEGVVHRVVQDQIQISFGQDTTEPEVWFPYATVYSSPDGAGWYCMPEKGDAVRVYFPDCDERKGIAISSIHLACDLRENPDVKYIRSPYDKEIRFDSSAIRITNNQGMSVILDDKEGILLESNGNIIFSAGGDIEIQSGRELNIIGCEGISICQGDNEIEIKDGIRQTANKIWQR